MLLLEKYENLQTLGEWIEVIRLARDQAQQRYQKGESHFFEILSNTALFYKNAICNFPKDLLFVKPITHHEILA